MSDDLIIFYFYTLGLLAAFTFSFVVVVTFKALQEKLNGGNFIDSLLWHWDNS